MEKNFKHAEKLAAYLTHKTGTPLGVVSQHMSASDQRALFGRFLGKGRIIIDGENETITHRVKVCFGMDYDDRSIIKWVYL